ncbi:MAG TPA: hypothetical protein VL727_04495 [Puia sp.]|nr:hypothetical protein [Puia sp.]
MVKKNVHIQSLVRASLLAGTLHDLEDLLGLIPKNLLARRLAKTENEIDLLLKRVEEFKIREIYKIGNVCGLNATEIYNIVEASYFRQKIK